MPIDECLYGLQTLQEEQDYEGLSQWEQMVGVLNTSPDELETLMNNENADDD